jgi:predicted phosphodiesterase
MIEDSKPASQYYPAETKLFNGIIYSVLVPLNESRFSVVIGEGSEPLHEDVECKDLAPENHAELFARGHSHAQKIIQSEDHRLQPFIEKLNEKAGDD